MKEKFLAAELWDNMHYLFRHYNDRMVHATFTYDFRIDAAVLQKALDFIYKDNPVLHSAFECGFFRSRWKVMPYRIEDVVTFREVSPADFEAERMRFLCQCLPPESPLQMVTRVFFHGEKSTLCILVNHMCMDGGSLKLFMNALCKTYNKMANGEAPEQVLSGNRSHKAVYACMEPEKQKAAQRLYKNVNQKDDSFFPLSESSGDDQILLLWRDISGGLLEQIHQRAKKIGATVNDLLLACYFQSLYEVAGYDPERKLSISCAIDLRRHLTGKAKESFTNHTAWMQCEVPHKGKTVFETLEYARKSVAGFKSDPFMGLHGLPLVATLFRVLPHALAEWLIDRVYSTPPCSMSNMGRLDVQGLSLQGKAPERGFITGTVKYKPYVLMSATSLGDDLTIAFGIRGNEKDRATVERFFDRFVENARGLVGERK